MSITAPTIQGDTIYMGAAHLIFDKVATKADWKYIWAEGDVQVRLVRPESDVNVGGFGRVAGRVTDELVEVTFTPSSRIDSYTLAYLYGSILAAMPGSSYFGTTDTPVYVHTLAGRILAITNCRPTSFPAINFGIAPKRFDGAVTLTGILGRGLARTATGALFTTWANEAFTAAPDEDDFAAGPCAAAWSLLAGTAIEGVEAWKLTPKVQLVPRVVHNLGTVGYTVASVELEASCTPANLLEANLWATYAIGTTRALGGTALAGGDLTLTEDSPGLTAVVKGARLVEAPTRFDSAATIAGQCVWRNQRKVETGAWTPAGTLAMTA
jgi:hypothetical protein